MDAKVPSLKRSLIIATALAVAAACSQETATGPEETVNDEDAVRHGVLAAISCAASVASGTLACESKTGARNLLGPQLLIIGGQGDNLQLTSTGVSYDAGTEIFEADVTVQNLMGQPLGTPDGSTVTGLRVFFHSGPNVTNGTGSVTVRDPDGTGAFTGVSQPYLEYMEIVSPGATSTAKKWEWDVPSTVNTFVFEVFIEADVPSSLSIGWDTFSPRTDMACWYVNNEPTGCEAYKWFNVTAGSGDVHIAAAVSEHSMATTVTGNRVASWHAAGEGRRYRVTLQIDMAGQIEVSSSGVCAKYAPSLPM